MKIANPIQESMFREMREKSIFEQAQTYAFQYLEQVFERNVYPTEAALSNLQFFEEPMPKEPAEAAGVIALLNQYGAPATTAMLGGRYFGFVNGSSVPAGLAAKKPGNLLGSKYGHAGDFPGRRQA